MADHNQPIIIIRKKKKGGHGGGHHGGAWKVAYADFVTAMMSFFLLLWLLNVTTSDQRKGIADYFAPMSISHSEGGSGGVMGGKSITMPDGAEISASSPPGLDDRSMATVGKGDEGEEDISGKSEKSAEGKAAGEKAAAAQTPEEKLAQAQDQVTKDAVALAESMKKEESRFKAAADMLKQALLNNPAMQDLAQYLMIDQTPEGLRIQIIDKDKFSLFPSGSSSPFEKGRDLLRLVGQVLSKLPNKISVTGHTDSNPYPFGSRRDNWDLSTDRANVSRTELMAGGVSREHIARVVGMADQEPFVPDPKDSRNRRISIVLLRRAPPPTLNLPSLPAASPVATTKETP
ncbi:MAG: flagellar motor protein MotB [Bdellovibrionales bacterium]|jgi:chemotaxis protein MotB